MTMIGFKLSKLTKDDDHGDYVIGNFKLQVDGDIPITCLRASNNDQCALLIGWPIDRNQNMLLSGEMGLELEEASSIESFYLDFIRPLLGSYLAILNVGGETRLYLDGLGTMSAVFDPNQQIAASTAASLLSKTEYQRRLDFKLATAMEVDREGWLSAGMTAHTGVERIIANHFLDLKQWTQHRHEWHEGPMQASSVQEKLAAIAHDTRDVVRALLNSGKRVTLGLTGGGDSRLLLAALRPFVDQIEFYTIDGPGSKFDVLRAQELASRFKLNHQLLPYVLADQSQRDEWDRMVGYNVRTANRDMHPSVFPLSNYFCIGGVGGEVGRRFLWLRDSRNVSISAISIVDRLKLPRLPELIRRVDAWLEELDCSDPFRVLDLAFLELRVSCWANCQSYANPKSIVLHPLSSFSSLGAMIHLSPAYKLNDGLITGFIESYWPELLELPINRFGDYRDYLFKISKLRYPAKIFRKVRQLIRAS